jgi:hypothetical protein
VSFALGLVTVLPLAAYACHAHEEGPAASVSDVVYETGASDEALLELLAAKADTSKAPVINLPKEAQVLPRNAPPTFSWTEAEATAALPILGPPAAPTERKSWHELWPTLFTFEGVAHAHGPPTNGNAYLLVFSNDASPNLVRVFTPRTSYTPTTAVLERLVTAQGPLRLQVTHAVFEDNRIATRGGPYPSKVVSFTFQR